MKFLCLECDAAMRLYRSGTPDEGSLDVRFECPKCSHQVAMLTNPFETQIVSSLGVTIGGDGGAEDREPMAAEPAPSPHQAAPEMDSSGSGESIPWTSAARRRLDRIPDFVRPMAVSGIEQYARDNGYERIDEEVLDKAKERFGM